MQNQRNNELEQLAEELTLRREVDKEGNIYYYNSNDEVHRVNGPAVINCNGVEYWLQNDKYHRLDGPAIVYPNRPALWCINGKIYTKAGFNAHPLVISHKGKIRHNKSCQLYHRSVKCLQNLINWLKN